MILRRVATLLLLAVLLAPVVAVVAEAAHVAFDHETSDSPLGRAGGLGLFRHGHLHYGDTAEHQHPTLVPNTTGIRTLPQVASGVGTATWHGAKFTGARSCSLAVAAERGGVGPPPAPPPRSIAILRI